MDIKLTQGKRRPTIQRKSKGKGPQSTWYSLEYCYR